jgi:uncharacterized protein (TIGR02246 family)
MSHPLTFTVFIALLTTAILTILAGGQQSEIAGHAADETAIRAIVADRWMAGWNAHNVHQFASMFSEDADFTNVLGMSASGRVSIEKFHVAVFERFFKHSNQTGEVTKIRFLRPDIAAVDVRWQMTGAVDDKGDPIPHRTGLANCVFTKSGGEWLVTIMYNTELTP